MSMSRLMAATTVMLGLWSTQGAAQEFIMRIGADSPTAGNVCTGYLDVWAEKIKAESGGRIGYEMHCDGMMGKVGESVNRVASGVLDVTWDLPAAYGDRFAGLSGIGVPGLYSDPEVGSGALWNAYASGVLGEEKEVRVIWLQVVENNTYFLKEKPADPASIAGIKIAMGSKVRAAVVEAAGGVPVALKSSEYYQAVSKGSVDGVMTTAGLIDAYSLQELTNYFMQGPFGGGMTFTVMSNSFYDSLPDDLKAVIDANTGYDTSRWAAAYLRDYEAAKLEEWLKLPGKEAYRLNEAEVAAWAPAFAAGEAAWVATIPDGATKLAAIRAAIAAEAK